MSPLADNEQRMMGTSTFIFVLIHVILSAIIVMSSVLLLYFYVTVTLLINYFHLPAGPDDFFDPPDRETMRLQKFGKLLAGPNTDLGIIYIMIR